MTPRRLSAGRRESLARDEDSLSRGSLLLEWRIVSPAIAGRLCRRVRPSSGKPCSGRITDSSRRGSLVVGRRLSPARDRQRNGTAQIRCRGRRGDCRRLCGRPFAAAWPLGPTIQPSNVQVRAGRWRGWRKTGDTF
jgi:hypothetical protein